MKTKFIFFTIYFFLVGIACFAQDASKMVTAHFKVYGNCAMCKKRIEAVLDHKGIKDATWNVKSKDLQITYNSGKITEGEIHKIIAAAGHDTDQAKASDEVYASLPYCCLYRESEATDIHHNP